MRKIIFALNSEKTDLTSLMQGEEWERRDITELGSIDYDLIKENKVILLVCCADKRKIKDLFASFELRSSNLPTVFLMEEEEKDIVKLCYQNDFAQIFLKSRKQLLLKAHINYTFDNYELTIRNNGQRWLKHIDPKDFTKKEFQIIEYIAQAPLTELSREELQNFIWGRTENTTNKLDVHICNLRKKLNHQSVIIHTNERGKVSLGFAKSLPQDLAKKIAIDSHLDKKVRV